MPMLKLPSAAALRRDVRFFMVTAIKEKAAAALQESRT
jgi:hypothetical protein